MPCSRSAIKTPKGCGPTSFELARSFLLCVRSISWRFARRSRFRDVFFVNLDPAREGFRFHYLALVHLRKEFFVHVCTLPAACKLSTHLGFVYLLTLYTSRFYASRHLSIGERSRT